MHYVSLLGVFYDITQEENSELLNSENSDSMLCLCHMKGFFFLDFPSPFTCMIVPFTSSTIPARKTLWLPIYRCEKSSSHEAFSTGLLPGISAAADF